jgi:putative FmdB family regulatory protein
MPIYEYQCASCGHHLVALQKISEEPLSDCPSCGRPGLQKLVSAAGFRLKGNGWYATDFKGGATKKQAEGGDEKSSQTNSASEAKSDAKDKASGNDSARAAAPESKS